MSSPNPSPDSAATVIEFLLKHDQADLALRLAQALAEEFPQGPFSHYLLHRVLQRTGNFTEAVAAIRQACALAPQEFGLKIHFCQSLNAIGRAQESEILMRGELNERPEWSEGKLELARSLGYQGKYQEAEVLLRELVRKEPANPIFAHQLSWYPMHRGNLREGQQLSVGLRPFFPWGARSLGLSQPMWSGGDCQGLRLCLIGEGGIGDEIIGARFAQILQARGARVVFACKPELVEIFRRINFFEEVVSINDLQRLHFDQWVPALDACALLQLEYADLPQKPFLSALPSFKNKWRAKISSTKSQLRVGIRWQGSATFEGEQMRRVPFTLMQAWSQLEGLQLFSLQKPCEEILPNHIIDLGPELETWEDTLAVLAELDLVITTCSSVAHAAAALGRPTWVLTPLMPYYIWAEPGDGSRWYPSARVFRQERYGDWEEPCKAILRELGKLTDQYAEYGIQNAEFRSVF